MSWGSIHQFVRMPIQGSEPELDYEVAGQVLQLNLAAFSRHRRNRAVSSSPMRLPLVFRLRVSRRVHGRERWRTGGAAGKAAGKAAREARRAMHDAMACRLTSAKALWAASPVAPLGVSCRVIDEML
jgi:hypothetical protein